MQAATPLVVAFVVVLAFLLLLAAFRSVAIPLVSIALPAGGALLVPSGHISSKPSCLTLVSG